MCRFQLKIGGESGDGDMQLRVVVIEEIEGVIGTLKTLTQWIGTLGNGTEKEERITDGACSYGNGWCHPLLFPLVLYLFYIFF